MPLILTGSNRSFGTAQTGRRRGRLDLPVAGSLIFIPAHWKLERIVMKSADQSGATRTVLSLTGMTCSGCAGTVTRVLQRLPGVTRAEVDLSSARALVEGSARPAELVAAAEAAGFGAQVVHSNDG
jgi:copper chaperone CopZ